MSWLGTAMSGLQGMTSSPSFQTGMKALGSVGNGMARAGGEPGAYSPTAAKPGSGLMGLMNKFKAKQTSTDIGQTPTVQGGGIGAPQPGAQGGTLFGSMGPPRSSVPSY